MSDVELLRRQRKSYAVILQSILRDYSYSPSSIFLLCEGKDADYYRPRVSAIFAGAAGAWLFHNCSGKRNLKLLSQAISANSALSMLRWPVFYDRDYENDIAQISQSNAYVTDGYSIENYYTSVSSVGAMISGLFFNDIVHVEADNQVRETVVRLYSLLKASAEDALSLFSQWA